MQDITVIPANLTTVVLETFLYGFLVLLFILMVYFLVNRRTLAGDKRPVKHHLSSLRFLGVALLFLFITAHWSIVLYKAYFAFIHLGTVALEDTFYADLDQPSEVVQGSLLFATMILANLLVVHRLWIIWARSRRVVLLPLCMTAMGAILGVVLVFELTKWEPRLRGSFHRLEYPWLIPAYVLFFAINLYSTGFIMYRIRRSVSKPAAGHSLMRFLSILAESAALQTLWLATTALVTFLRSDSMAFFGDCVPAVLGISNMLIHARVGLGWSQYSVDQPKAPHQVKTKTPDNALSMGSETA